MNTLSDVFKITLGFIIYILVTPICIYLLTNSISSLIIGLITVSTFCGIIAFLVSPYESYYYKSP